MCLLYSLVQFITSNLDVTAALVKLVDNNAMSLSYIGNGICSCNGTCTCNEGFSGEFCECRPNEECRDPVEREVSSPVVICPHVVMPIMQPLSVTLVHSIQCAYFAYCTLLSPPCAL